MESTPYGVSGSSRCHCALNRPVEQSRISFRRCYCLIRRADKRSAVCEASRYPMSVSRSSSHSVEASERARNEMLLAKETLITCHSPRTAPTQLPSAQAVSYSLLLHTLLCCEASSPFPSPSRLKVFGSRFEGALQCVDGLLRLEDAFKGLLSRFWWSSISSSERSEVKNETTFSLFFP